MRRGPAVAVLGLAGLLGGCARPISNAAFTEDARYASAVPGTDELAAPAAFVDAPSSAEADPVLAAAHAAAVAYTHATAPIAAIGDAMRASPPSDRSGDARGWRALTVAFSDASGVHVAWANVIVVDGTGLFDVVIEAAPAADGPYSPIADGWRLETGEGHLDVDVGADSDGAPMTLSIDVNATDDPGAVVALTDDALHTEAWATAPDAFAFSGTFAITADDATWPGSVAARAADGGGRADGELATADGTVPFTACWDATGSTTYVGGDDAIATLGSESSCP